MSVFDNQWIIDYVRFAATAGDEHSSYDADAEYQGTCYGTAADDEHHLNTQQQTFKSAATQGVFYSTSSPGGYGLIPPIPQLIPRLPLLITPPLLTAHSLLNVLLIRRFREV